MSNSLLSATMVALALSAVSAVEVRAAGFTSRSPWEAAQVAFGDVDETQWGTAGDPFPAGSPIHLPFGGITLSFDKELAGAEVPLDWDTWSGGNTPRVLVVPGLLVTATFSSAVSAFGLEMEPDSFGTTSMSLHLDDGSVITQPVSGLGGAAFFGWSDLPVLSFSLSASEEFAFGRMVQGSVSAVPDEGETLGLLGAGVLALGGLWRRQRAA